LPAVSAPVGAFEGPDVSGHIAGGHAPSDQSFGPIFGAAAAASTTAISNGRR
jgi:hypothetical protein